MNQQQYYTIPARTLGQAWTSFRTQIFTFRGRSTRAEFWWIVLLQILAGVALSVLTVPLSIAAAVADAPVLDLVGSLISNVFSLVCFILTLALVCRRFQDTGRSLTHALLVILLPIPLAVVAVFALFASLIAALGGSSASPVLLAVGVVPLLIVLAVLIYELVVMLTGSDPDNQYGPQRAGRVLVPVPAPVDGHPGAPQA